MAPPTTGELQARPAPYRPSPHNGPHDSSAAHGTLGKHRQAKQEGKSVKEYVLYQVSIKRSPL